MPKLNRLSFTDSEHSVLLCALYGAAADLVLSIELFNDDTYSDDLAVIKSLLGRLLSHSSSDDIERHINDFVEAKRRLIR